MNCLLFLSYVGNRTKIRYKAASKTLETKKNSLQGEENQCHPKQTNIYVKYLPQLLQYVKKHCYILYILLLYSQASRPLDFIYFLKDYPAEEECFRKHYYTAILMCCTEPLLSLSFPQ